MVMSQGWTLSNIRDVMTSQMCYDLFTYILDPLSICHNKPIVFPKLPIKCVKFLFNVHKIRTEKRKFYWLVKQFNFDTKVMF